MAKRGRPRMGESEEERAEREARREERKAARRNSDWAVAMRAVSKARREFREVARPVEDGERLVLEAGLPYRGVAEFSQGVGVDEALGARLLAALAMVAAGNRWKDVLARTGMSYSEICCRKTANAEYRRLFTHVLDRQAEALAAKAHDALDELVEDGERIPVVANGEVIDERRVRPVKAIELALKAGDRRFRDGGGASQGGGGMTFNIVMPAKASESPEVVEVDGGGGAP